MKPAKAPFYVFDRTRQIVVGQFFKLSSAQEVAALLKHHSVNDGAVIIGDGKSTMYSLYAKQWRKLTEAGLQAIAAEKYLPEPSPRDYWNRNAFIEGGIYTTADGMFVAVNQLSVGPKYVTWRMYNLQDGRTWTFKRRSGSDVQKPVRMATPNEWARAQGKSEQRDAEIAQRKSTNNDRISELGVSVGDTILVNFSDGPAPKVVEAINHKTGRVAIKREGMYASRYEKRRFIDAKHILKIVEKSAYPRRNPINEPMWMR